MCGRSDWSCHVVSTTLTLLGKLNHIIVTLRHTFTLVDRLSWVNVGGGCYIKDKNFMGKTNVGH